MQQQQQLLLLLFLRLLLRMMRKISTNPWELMMNVRGGMH
jgi:hypothetical protein